MGLCLSRKVGQFIYIGDDILIKVSDIRGEHVMLNIQAPDNIDIWRDDIKSRVLRGGRENVRTVSDA